MGVRRSIVTSVIVFAFTGLFSLLGQGTRGQQPTYKVSGKLVGGPSLFASRFGPTVLFSLNLRPARDDEREVAPVVLRGKLNADGSFEVLNVSPGTYVFMVNPAGAVLRSVPTIVVTNRDVTGLEIPLVLTDVVTNRQNLQTAWSLPGYWSGVATSKDGMFATSPAVDAATTPPFATATMPGHIREIDYDGTVRREIPIRPFRSMRLAVAHFSGSSAPVFLMYGSFVYAPNGGEPLTDVRAFDEKGNLVWAHPSLEGASDVAVLDSGNNLDNVAVGYTTRGLLVLNSQGQLLWESTTNPYVYHLAAGDVRGEGRPQVVTPSNFGRVHIFSGARAEIANFDPGTQTSMVRVGKLSDSNRTATIFAVGANQTDSAATVSSLSGDGKINWSVRLPSNITPLTIYSASLASGRPWLAVALLGGQVYVVDAKQGTIIGSIDGQSLLPEVGWVAGEDGAAPRLVVSTEKALNGYIVGAK